MRGNVDKDLKAKVDAVTAFMDVKVVTVGGQQWVSVTAENFKIVSDYMTLVLGWTPGSLDKSHIGQVVRIDRGAIAIRSLSETEAELRAELKVVDHVSRTIYGQ